MGIWRRGSRTPRAIIVVGYWTSADFSPRFLRGERPSVQQATHKSNGFQSSLPARGATLGAVFINLPIAISIPAPREGGDPTTRASSRPPDYFNPRSPRGERLRARTALDVLPPFQSPLPARGATPYFEANYKGAVISILAPREGSDYNSMR